MIRNLCIAAIVFLAFGQMNGQYYDNAIGLRAGTLLQVTYKQKLGREASPHAIEAMAGWRFDRGIHGGVFYEYHIEFAPDPRLQFYGGAGLVVGGYNTGMAIGVAGIIGGEYNFKEAPFIVGIDWQPTFGSGIVGYGLAGLNIRYNLSGEHKL